MTDKNDQETDTSLSFIEPLFQTVEIEQIPQRSISRPVASIIIDPAFLEYTIVIPRKIEKLLKAVDNINFIYNIEDCTSIFFKRTIDKTPDDIVYTILVSDYESFDFPKEIQTNLLFVLGKQRYKALQRHTQRKEYIKSAGSGKQYEARDEYKMQKWRYLEYQIITGINIVYIEDSQDLHREIKALASLLNKKHRYTPKVKSYGDSQKEEYFRMVLRAIPGVSESVAKALSDRFSSFTELRNTLACNRKEVENLTVYDAMGKNKRAIGRRCCERLAIAFLSDEGNRKV
ncbi:hypothetical protein PAEPH01_0269 [Pancytospora epiphaga]|nr:hypothetical protein PAEPH01_0269 [Pancytospora epiphaga]